MQPAVSLSCDSSSSWVYIGVFKPKRLMGSCSSEELAARIATISLSFNRFARSAVFRSRHSNHVAIFSVWDKDSVDILEPCKQPQMRRLRRFCDSLHRRRKLRKAYPVTPPSLLIDAFEKALSAVSRPVHVSWYEVSCWDFKERNPSSSATPQISSSLSAPPLVHGDLKRLSIPISIPGSLALSQSISCCDFSEGNSLQPTSHMLPPLTDQEEDKAVSSSLRSSSPASSSTSSLLSKSTVHLSLGDIVHLRCIVGSHQAHHQDVLSYSCLAILKAYFPQTEGLHSYTFYRSLDASRMAGLGVWQDIDAASTFLNAPDGASEERYWRSMGAKTRFEIYEVAALVA